MKTMKKILYSVLAIVILLVVVGFLLPRTRHLERSLLIDAPPSVVFAQVNGFMSFNDWSPFVATTPDAEYTWEGPDFGVGAKLSWVTQDPQAESGSQTVVASTPYERVDVEIDLGDGGTAQSAMLLRPEGVGTHLTWTFDTDFGLNLFGRYFGLFLERELSTLYAQGLMNLKRIAESMPKVDWSDIEIDIRTIPSQTIAYATGSSGNDPAEISAALGAAYGRVAVFVTANGMQLAGQPLAITNYWDERGWGFDAGIPIDGGPTRGVGTDSPVRMGETYGGRVVRAIHVGPYTELPSTYEKARAFAEAHRLQTNGRSWEVFVSDPGNTPQEELTTEVYYPVK